MRLPLHIRRQIGANRVASHSLAAPAPVEAVPVVSSDDVPTSSAPAPAPPWFQRLGALPTPVTVTAPEPEPEPEAGVDFSDLKPTSLKADLLGYAVHYGLPVNDTNTKVEIWAAIEAHKASLAG